MKAIFFFTLLLATLCLKAQQNPGAQILLPENLAYFTATRAGNSVSLKWQTVNEQESKGFIVQRRTNGDWEQIGFTLTNAPGGTSSSLVSYEFTDGNTFKGVSQYRVTEVNNHGKQKNSEIRAVKGEWQDSRTIVYPNPSSNGKVNLVFDNSSAKDVVLFDASGRMVKWYAATTATSLSFENLPTGFYTVRITNRANNEVSTQTVVVSKPS